MKKVAKSRQLIIDFHALKFHFDNFLLLVLLGVELYLGLCMAKDVANDGGDKDLLLESADLTSWLGPTALETRALLLSRLAGVVQTVELEAAVNES